MDEVVQFQMIYLEQPKIIDSQDQDLKKQVGGQRTTQNHFFNVEAPAYTQPSSVILKNDMLSIPFPISLLAQLSWQKG